MHKNKNKYVFNTKKGYCKIYYKDKYGLIDIEDYPKVKQYNWIISNGYLTTDIYISNKRTTLLLHRLIMQDNLKEKLVIDHINRDRLNNRKSNLRVCSQADNTKNKSISDRNKYNVIGVTKVNSRYCAFISTDGKYINLGKFDDIEDAIKERLKAEVVYFGEYAPQKHLFNKYDIDINENYNVHKYIGRKQGNDKNIKGIHKCKYKLSNGEYKYKWRVEFSINNVKYYLGLYDDLDVAIKVKEEWCRLNVINGKVKDDIIEVNKNNLIG